MVDEMGEEKEEKKPYFIPTNIQLKQNNFGIQQNVI